MRLWGRIGGDAIFLSVVYFTKLFVVAAYGKAPQLERFALVTRVMAAVEVFVGGHGGRFRVARRRQLFVKGR